MSGTLALTGPTTGTVGRWSTAFTVTATSLSGSDTVTLSDSSAGGTFSSLVSGAWVTGTSLSLASGSSTTTVRYTAAAAGTASISISDTLGATISGSPISYVASAPAVPIIRYSIGGGWISSTQTGALGSATGIGMLGVYYSDASFTTAQFQRFDKRIRHDWPAVGGVATAYPGGAPYAPLNAVGPTNWSAKWYGTLYANYSETYTFYLTSLANTVALKIGPHGGSLSTLISTTGTQSATLALTAGQLYDVELDLTETSATHQKIELEWSSPSTPREIIDVVQEVGVNADGYDGVFANAVNAGYLSYWTSPTNPNGQTPQDSGGWPYSDGYVTLAQQDDAIAYGGTYAVQFTGQAAVTSPIGSIFQKLVMGTWTNIGSTTSPSDGYDSGSNTTTLRMIQSVGADTIVFKIGGSIRNPASPNTISSISGNGTTVSVVMTSSSQPGIVVSQYVTITGTGIYDGSYAVATASGADFTFASTITGSATPGGRACDGITNLYIMRPTTLGGATPHTVGTLFNETCLALLANFTFNRNVTLGQLGNPLGTWADRTPPTQSLWSGYIVFQGSGITARVTGANNYFPPGPPLEVQVALCNAAGLDFYMGIPVNSDPTWITNALNLVRYGSDGTTPYTSSTAVANPAWPGLNPNLRLYTYIGDELWANNTVSGYRNNGWANQQSQRALYDYLTTPGSDTVYPGGYSAALADGAWMARYTGAALPAWNDWTGTYTGSPSTIDGNIGSPQYFSNALPGGKNGTMFIGWVALRFSQIAIAGKTIFGELDILATDPYSRFRPNVEWQGADVSDGGSGMINIPTIVGEIAPGVNPVSWYVFSGGGGWYEDFPYGSEGQSIIANCGLTDVVYANDSFATGDLTGWSHSGTVTVVPVSGLTGYSAGYPTDRLGSVISNAVCLAPGASIDQSVAFSGAYAATGFYLQYANSADPLIGISFSGSPSISTPVLSEGGISSGSLVFCRTNAFQTGSASSRTVTFTNNGSGNVYLTGLAFQTVNGIYADASANGILSQAASIQRDTNATLPLGLHQMHYEGGFDIQQSAAGGGAPAEWGTISELGFGINPNIGTAANLDSRAVPYATATLNHVANQAAAYPCIFESWQNLPSWAVCAPTYYDVTNVVPKIAAVQAVQQAPATITYGKTVGQHVTMPVGQNSIVLGNTISGVYNLGSGTYTLLMAYADFPNGDNSTAVLTVQLNGVSVGTITIPQVQDGSGGQPGGAFTLSLGSLAASQYAIALVYTSQTLVGGGTGDVPIPATENVFTVEAAATQLVITQQPPASVGQNSTIPLTVAGKDASGNTSTIYTGNVTVAIGTNPSSGTLSGTKTVAAVAGVATFTDLTINNLGSGYTLTATAPGLTSATSSPFNVVPAVPSSITVVGSPVIAQNTATAGFDTTGANLIVVACSGNAVTPGFTDTYSNTPVALTKYTSTSGQVQQLFYIANPTVGPSHVFTPTVNETIYVIAVSGAAASPYDQSSGTAASGVSTIQPGSFVPSENNCLVVAGLGFWTGSSVSINGAFADLSENYGGSGTTAAGAGAYEIQSTAVAVNPTWSWTTAGETATSQASFLPATGGGGGGGSAAGSALLAGF